MRSAVRWILLPHLGIHDLHHAHRRRKLRTPRSHAPHHRMPSSGIPILPAMHVPHLWRHRRRLLLHLHGHRRLLLLLHRGGRRGSRSRRRGGKRGSKRFSIDVERERFGVGVELEFGLSFLLLFFCFLLLCAVRFVVLLVRRCRLRIGVLRRRLFRALGKIDLLLFRCRTGLRCVRRRRWGRRIGLFRGGPLLGILRRDRGRGGARCRRGPLILLGSRRVIHDLSDLLLPARRRIPSSSDRRRRRNHARLQLLRQHARVQILVIEIPQYLLPPLLGNVNIRAGGPLDLLGDAFGLGASRIVNVIHVELGGVERFVVGGLDVEFGFVRAELIPVADGAGEPRRGAGGSRPRSGADVSGGGRGFGLGGVGTGRGGAPVEGVGSLGGGSGASDAADGAFRRGDALRGDAAGAVPRGGPGASRRDQAAVSALPSRDLRVGLERFHGGGCSS
mmetsp:Transcript_1388/g.3063  ORF Transcript_1388/g.3063 Transcript_1388/m.3063 type:complete len:447 (+) Transcript_1388:1078-2418(+)